MEHRSRAWVVGLSDIGRSPRLQNHAVSLAVQGEFLVDVVGQKGSKPLEELTKNSSIQIHTIPDTPACVHVLPRLVALPLKAVLQALILLLLLLRLPKPDVVLLQVPPAIPTLFLCWLVCLLRRARLIVDWHNFAYSLMAMSLGERNILVKAAECHEKFWGRRARQHLCVSRAMQEELATAWNIRAAVFYDRPPAQFHRASLAEKHELMLRLKHELETPLHPHDCCSLKMAILPSAASSETAVAVSPQDPESPGSAEVPEALDLLWTGSPSPPKKIKSPSSEKKKARPKEKDKLEEVSARTICTEEVAGKIRLRQDRPVLVVSSTSWTPDEDFGILLDAALQYDAKSREADLPRLLFLVTGKGPLREHYRTLMQAMDLRNVAFRTLWLDSAVYPVLLGCCDLGVSLHTSSSGVDLPMKVVDMFGCGLPVLAASYECISELVQHGVNGLHFMGATELAKQLAELLLGFPDQAAHLQRLSAAVTIQREDSSQTWNSQWDQVVKPILQITHLD